MIVTRVFINGISAKSGGGKSILRNFLTVLRQKGSPYSFVVLVPHADGYSEFSGPDVEIVVGPTISKTVLLPLVNKFILPRMIRQYKCDVVFNLADIPIPTHQKQVFLFDWPYAVFPNSPAWALSNFRDRLVRNIKLLLFKRYLRHVDLMIAQNEVMQARLQRFYKLGLMKVVPNAVSAENSAGQQGRAFDLGTGYKVLCLSHYYTHKNLEIFIPLAQLIRESGSDIKIVITISAQQGKGARELLQTIQDTSLDDIIINVGPVPMQDVPALYQQTDGLLLPTFLESFSGTYVEAMFHKKPIFTSDYDFARGVCKEGAFYFDPTDAQQILQQIELCRTSPEERDKRVQAGSDVLESLPTWQQTFEAYIKAIEAVADAR